MFNSLKKTRIEPTEFPWVTLLLGPLVCAYLHLFVRATDISIGHLIDPDRQIDFNCDQITVKSTFAIQILGNQNQTSQGNRLK